MEGNEEGMNYLGSEQDGYPFGSPIAKKTVHDVGTGPGLFSQLFSSKVGGQGSLHSVDISDVFHRVEGKSTDWIIGREGCNEGARV